MFSMARLAARRSIIISSSWRQGGRYDAAIFRKCLITTTTTTDNADAVKNEYVHPLSQLVLDHLSSTRGNWIRSQQLDDSLKIHRDGTFSIHFQGSSNKSHNKIWTSYEPEEKKHWLTMKKGELVGRFMLQDNMMPAWHSDRRSIPERIHDAVETMIQKIEEDCPTAADDESLSWSLSPSSSSPSQHQPSESASRLRRRVEVEDELQEGEEYDDHQTASMDLTVEDDGNDSNNDSGENKKK